MQIYLAKTAGFCMGVERALEKVMAASRDKQQVYTLGPLIHNPQEIERLKKMNVIAIDSPPLEENSTVIIRTHGISPQLRQQLTASGANIQDATCPRVARVQGIIKGYAQKGWQTIIVGDRGHAEVVGLLGFTMGRGHIVSSEEEVAALPDLEKVCVVSQTTMNRQLYSKLAERIKNRFKECRVFDTICDSTADRQHEIQQLCQLAEAIIVVGGKNSANTARLCTIAEGLSVPAFHIETAEELDLEKLKNFSKVGVSAGASTPTWVIDQVVKRLIEIGQLVEMDD